MPSLGLAQLTALQRLLELHDSRTALATFAEEQFGYYSRQCATEMVNGQEDLAREHAYFAKCYQNMLDELKKFTDKQAER